LKSYQSRPQSPYDPAAVPPTFFLYLVLPSCGAVFFCQGHCPFPRSPQSRSGHHGSGVPRPQRHTLSSHLFSSPSPSTVFDHAPRHLSVIRQDLPSVAYAPPGTGCAPRTTAYFLFDGCVLSAICLRQGLPPAHSFSFLCPAVVFSKCEPSDQSMVTQTLNPYSVYRSRLCSISFFSPPPLLHPLLCF